MFLASEKRLKCEHIQTSEDELLNGLVGPRSVLMVNIEDVQCKAILDSGSQVTTIFQSFHGTYLSSLPILPLRDILEVEGAGGQNVPYLCYVEISLDFQKISQIKLSLLAR